VQGQPFTPSVPNAITLLCAKDLRQTARQTVDWLAPLGPGGTLDIGICQISGLIGRGASTATTLTF